MRRTPSKTAINARRWGTRIAQAMFLLVAGPFVAFAARLHWLCDLASQFRIQYFWGLSVVSAVLALWEQLFCASIVAMFLIGHAAPILPLYFPPARSKNAARTIRLLSLNVRRTNVQHARVIEFVRELRPDIVLFFEVDDDWVRALSPLGDRLPHSQIEARIDSRGIALISRIPFDAVEVLLLPDDIPILGASLTICATTLNVFGIHPYPPITRQMSELRDRQMGALAKAVVSAEGEAVVIGDFNMTSWAPAFQEFVKETGLRDSRVGRGVQSTWPARLPAILRVPIDHCLVSSGIGIVDRKVGPDVGSDHLPIIVDLAVN